MPKLVSMKIDPNAIPGSVSPTTVTMGSRAFRVMWVTTTVRSRRPFARAVRM